MDEWSNLSTISDVNRTLAVCLFGCKHRSTETTLAAIRILEVKCMAFSVQKPKLFWISLLKSYKSEPASSAVEWIGMGSGFPNGQPMGATGTQGNEAGMASGWKTPTTGQTLGCKFYTLLANGIQLTRIHMVKTHQHEFYCTSEDEDRTWIHSTVRLRTWR